MNWTIAAFGEEFTYRIVLMRGISFILNDTRQAQFAAVIIQSVMFGLIHAYQGPAGIIGSTFSGLVFGTVTIASRWSIWPSAIAHGTNNTIGIIALYGKCVPKAIWSEMRTKPFGCAGSLVERIR